MTNYHTETQARRLAVAGMITDMVRTSLSGRTTVVSDEMASALKAFYPDTKQPEVMGHRVKCNINKMVFGDSTAPLSDGAYINVVATYAEGEILFASITHTTRVGTQSNTVEVTVYSSKEHARIKQSEEDIAAG